MAKPWSLRLGDINLAAGQAPSDATEREERPFRIALLGNFSGRSGPTASLAGRRFVAIDRDNFDEVLARLDVQVRLPLAGEGAPPLTIRCCELEDFHPDRLFERLEVFAALRSLRDRLSDSKSFPAAAAEVRNWAGAAAPAPAPVPPPAVSPPAAVPPTESGNLLEQVLGSAPAPAPGPVAGVSQGDWNAYLRQVVAPHLVPGAPPDQDDLIARVDAATGAQMRAILHHPAFQAVEAAWRALSLLVRRLETDENLRLALLDVTRNELAADLGGVEDLRSSATYKLLVEQAGGTAGTHPWAVVAGNYTFAPTAEDALLLARIGAVARAGGFPFLAAADPRLFGCESPAATPDPDDWRAAIVPEAAEVWRALRQTPQAASLGLAAPRFLLRLPYAEGATDRFDFEELPEGARHEDYLWGNPAFACALLLGQAFNRSGWGMRAGQFLEVGDLPAHVYREDGEGRLKPCAEALLSDRAAERIWDSGVMPLLSVEGRNQVQLARFQSLAEPATALAGPWS